MKWRISVLLIITGLLAVLSFSEIKEFGNDLKYPAESAVNITSYSQERDRQLLLIVLAVSLDTPIIIFDEVMNGLDPINRRKTIQLMKKLKKTKLVLVSSHQLYDVRDISDRIAFVYDKKVEIYSNKSELDLNQLYENLIEGGAHEI